MVSTLQLFHPDAAPRFGPNQMVQFLGGCGTIKEYHSDSGSWAYIVEMEMGPEPAIGRIGLETTVLLYETDIQDTTAENTTN
jgi:hypothetical protein